jgi:hypothetical protein
MPIILAKDKDGNVIPNFNLTTTLSSTIMATITINPQRLNPWYYTIALINNKLQKVYVKVIQGKPAEIQFME